MEGAEKSILVIDDDQEIRETLVFILGKHYQVLPARYAKEGLRMLDENTGLVFLDYRLPDMTGLEALEQIKDLCPEMPVVFITGHGSEDVCRQAFKLGVCDYIRKPFDADEIYYVVDSLMKGRQAIKQELKYEIRFDEFTDPGEVKTEDPKNETASDNNLLNILKVKDYIDGHYTEPISISDASKRACMSQSSFYKHFKSLAGKSFIDYVNHMRVEKAKSLLEDESLSIKDIASKLGYGSASYFTETFKRINRCTPAEFRRNLVNNGT